MAPTTSFQMAPNTTAMTNMSTMVYDPAPFINTIYIADPSAHVFNDRLYI